jgi:hypothetical protein
LRRDAVDLLPRVNKMQVDGLRVQSATINLQDRGAHSKAVIFDAAAEMLLRTRRLLKRQSRHR